MSTPTTIEARISHDLAQFDPVDAEIAKLAQEYHGLQINGPDDKDGRKIVHAAWQVLRDTRLGAEKLHKALKEDALKYTQAVDARKRQIVGAISDMEDRFYADWKAFDAAIDARKRAEAERAEKERTEMLERRRQSLYALGLFFDGAHYVSKYEGVAPVTTLMLEQGTGEQFAEAERKAWIEIEAARVEAERIEAERIEAERIAKLEAERLQRIQKELDEKVAQMHEMRVQSRRARLLGIGCSELSGGTMLVFFGDMDLWSLSATEIDRMDDRDFEVAVSAAMVAIEDAKKRTREAAEWAEKQERHQARLRMLEARVKRLKDSGWVHMDGEHEPYLSLCDADHKVIMTLLYDSEQGITGASDDKINECVAKGLVIQQAMAARHEAETIERIRKEELKRIEDEKAASAAAEQERKAQQSDAQKWQEWRASIKTSAPSMQSQIGKHGVKHLLQLLEDMTPGMVADLAD
jgi:chemosensory pili system protein ChpA (sensor histidine kinase/response regulator)